MQTRKEVTKFVNLTQHEINLHLEDIVMNIPMENKTARCAMGTEGLQDMSYKGLTVPCIRHLIGDPVGIPDPEPGVVYIVSNIVLSALKSTRDDVVSPDTTAKSIIKDKNGQIVGVRRFRR